MRLKHIEFSTANYMRDMRIFSILESMEGEFYEMLWDKITKHKELTFSCFVHISGYNGDERFVNTINRRILLLGEFVI